MQWNDEKSKKSQNFFNCNFCFCKMWFWWWFWAGHFFEYFIPLKKHTSHIIRRWSYLLVCALSERDSFLFQLLFSCSCWSCWKYGTLAAATRGARAGCSRADRFWAWRRRWPPLFVDLDVVVVRWFSNSGVLPGRLLAAFSS